MTRQSHDLHFSLRRLRWALLLPGASFVSLVGVLAVSVAQAQESPSEPVPIAEPTAIEPPLPSAADLAVPSVSTQPQPTVEPELIVPEFALPAPTDSTEPYIDSTNYGLGATERTPPAPVGLPPGFSAPETADLPEPSAPTAPIAVQVGPMAISESGLSVTAPKMRDYYNRTVRPPGLLGNGNLRLIFPLSIPAPITSAFGWRIHPISGQNRFHSGTDIGAPLGTPVIAAYAGRVAIADFLGGYGLAVTLSHNKGAQQTLYAHLSEIFVKPGEEIKQGMVIGRVGSTGNSTGPHLHFEFRQQSPDGWVALDAGTQLELALAQLVSAFQVAQGLPADRQFGELIKSNLTLGKVAQFSIPLKRSSTPAVTGGTPSDPAAASSRNPVRDVDS